MESQEDNALECIQLLFLQNCSISEEPKTKLSKSLILLFQKQNLSSLLQLYAKPHFAVLNKAISQISLFSLCMEHTVLIQLSSLGSRSSFQWHTLEVTVPSRPHSGTLPTGMRSGVQPNVKHTSYPIPCRFLG